ncbi:MAG TPA: glycosyltransferase [Nitrospirales bacterium]|nr:group 1 family glycosyltransferase [Nitrospiraceae bacterium]HNP29166.1 glycosyltransferase [Nitrospirales bacterium]
MSRPIILTFVRYFLPGYKSGGPVQTLANMVEALGDEFEFRIITSDRDMLDSQPYSGIALDAWNRVQKSWVYYVSPGKRSIRDWGRLIRETPNDVIYLNSLFDPIFTVLPLLAQKLAGSKNKPVVVAPRGELSPGALAQKFWKKNPFLSVVKTIGLYRAVLWHASSEDEAQLISQRFGTAAKVAVACNLSALGSQSDFNRFSVICDKPLRIVFLSRISKMKNLDFALMVLQKSHFPVQFDIWGTLEDKAYWRTCQKLMESMPDHVEVRYRGVAEHAEVNSILSNYDLFFLPTLGENYGHVIAEALSVGTPVLLSDQTPWRNLSCQGVGWDLPLENGVAGFLEAIAEALRKVEIERDAWRQRVFEFAKDRLNDPALLEANRALFLRVIAGKV